MRRYWKLCRALSYGAITFGILQALEMVSVSELFTNFLALLLSLFASLLFGGDPTQFTT